MTKYSRLVRKSTASWIAGTVAVPETEYVYRVEDLDFNIENIDTTATNAYIGEYCGEAPRPTSRYSTQNFTVEFTPMETNTAPPIGALARSAGMIEKAIDDSGTTFYRYSIGDLHLASGTPAGDVYPLSVTTNNDRDQCKAKNCVSNLQVRLAPNGPARLSVSMRGMVDDDVADKDNSSNTEADVDEPYNSPYPYSVQNTDTRIYDLKGIEVSYPILSLVQATTPGEYDGFVIDGDHTDYFTRGTTFVISNSHLVSAFEKTYTVVSSSYNSVSTDTTVYVEEQLSGFTLGSPNYYIIQYVWRCYSNLVFKSWDFDLGNVIDPREDMNGTFGVSQPIPTSNAPKSTMSIEATAFSEFNPYQLFVKHTPLRIVSTVGRGYGAGEAITYVQDVYIDSRPTKSESNGDMIYSISVSQATGSFKNIAGTPVNTKKYTFFWNDYDPVWLA